MIKVLVPRENVNDESVVILAVNFTSGSMVEKGDIVASIETSKTNIDVDAPKDGMVTHELEVGGEIDVGAILFSLSDAVSVGGEKECQSVMNSSEALVAAVENTNVKFSTAAKKRAHELGVKLSQFSDGWVTSEEIERSVGISTPKFTRQKIAVDRLGNNRESIPLISPSTSVAISKRKQVEAKILIAGDHASTTSTIGLELRIGGDRVVQPPFLFKDSISDLIVFEAAKLLRLYSNLNASYIDERSWAQYEQVNFGWSFDNGKNLKVLAINNADQISLGDLQDEVARLLDLYESGDTIPIGLLTNSTVTFSDLSHSSASFMLPLINGKQTLILGLVRKSRNVFEVFASFDHRVSEGLTVARFLADLKERVLSYYSDQDGITNISCYACGKSMTEEIALGHRGFIKMTLASGEDENLCRNCFEGW